MVRKIVAVNERGLRIGEDHPRAVLSNHEIDLVFELVEDGLTSKQIAKIMEVSLDSIKKIRCGQRRCQVADRWKTVHVAIR